MLRTALLGGNTITLDADLSKYIETVSDQGVIEGLEVSSNSVAPGKAWVKATRSNGETIMTLVQNTEALAVDTSGTKKIWLEIKQEAIDNGLLNNEDGTGIAEIKTGSSIPSQNFLLLASVAAGQVKDERNLIPKIQSVAQKTSTLEEKMTTAEGKITQLVEAGTQSYLSKMLVVGGTYQEGDVLFEKDGKAYPTTIRLTRPDVHHTKPISTYTPLFELDIPEGKDFKMIIEEGWSDNEVYLTIGSAYSAGYIDNAKYGYISGIKSKKRYEVLLSGAVSGQKIYVTVNKDRYTSDFLHLQGIQIVGKIGTDEVILYPRAIKSIGEKVECTILGLHTDGNYIGIGRRVPINKSIEGLATAEWTAPANGLLEYQYYTENNYSLLNGNIMFQNRSGDLPHYIYVKYGDVIRISVDNRGRNGTYKTTLLSFIPL